MLQTRQNWAALRGWPSHAPRRLPVHCCAHGLTLFGHRMAAIASRSAQNKIGRYPECVYWRPLPASTPLHGHRAPIIVLQITSGYDIVGNCHTMFTPRKASQIYGKHAATSSRRRLFRFLRLPMFRFLRFRRLRFLSLSRLVPRTMPIDGVCPRLAWSYVTRFISTSDSHLALGISMCSIFDRALWPDL